VGQHRKLSVPQRPTAANAEVLSVEWLFEPFWPGKRLIARIEGSRVSLTDENGEPTGPETAEAESVLARAVRAERAVVDGIWSAQPFIGDDSSDRAFVAVDLLELDGEPLYDVPLQERRRLLESVIDETVQVRLSPVVKHPLGGWLISWRANGFTHYVAKHQNARYRPGERNDDWLKLEVRAQAPIGLVGQLVGTKNRIRRIR
jgi:ATP-dependent DNA ligase